MLDNQNKLTLIIQSDRETSKRTKQIITLTSYRLTYIIKFFKLKKKDYNSFISNPTYTILKTRIITIDLHRIVICI